MFIFNMLLSADMCSSDFLLYQPAKVHRWVLKTSTFFHNRQAWQAIAAADISLVTMGLLSVFGQVPIHMISNNYNYKKVHIQITTYKKYSRNQNIGKTTTKNMNHEKEITKRFARNDDNTKFICSICLNAKPKCDDDKKPECNKRKSKSCPICQRGLDNCVKISTENKLKPNKSDVKEKSARVISNYLSANTKTVQTSQTDVSHGLNLLNEVLTVFQSKKQLPIEKEKHGKTVIVKDASVATEYYLSNKEMKPVLTVSKIFHLSIEDSITNGNNKFTVVNSSQPQRNKNSQYSIHLVKHKSSSIPQMKLEELKNSLKEKAKSKDAIEEVNRMFATVKNNALEEILDDTNRPMIRNGPRVLPVVKTKTFENKCSSNNTPTLDDNNRGFKKAKESQNCKFCQTNNYLLSSGDSLLNPDSCHQKISDKMCSKCIHMVKCHHHSHRQIHDACQHCCQRCVENRCHHNCYEDNHDGDSCASF